MQVSLATEGSNVVFVYLSRYRDLLPLASVAGPKSLIIMVIHLWCQSKVNQCDHLLFSNLCDLVNNENEPQSPLLCIIIIIKCTQVHNLYIET